MNAPATPAMATATSRKMNPGEIAARAIAAEKPSVPTMKKRRCPSRSLIRPAAMIVAATASV